MAKHVKTARKHVSCDHILYSVPSHSFTYYFLSLVAKMNQSPDMQFQKCIVNTCAVGPIGSGKKLN